MIAVSLRWSMWCWCWETAAEIAIACRRTEAPILASVVLVLLVCLSHHYLRMVQRMGLVLIVLRVIVQQSGLMRLKHNRGYYLN